MRSWGAEPRERAGARGGSQSRRAGSLVPVHAVGHARDLELTRASLESARLNSAKSKHRRGVIKQLPVTVIRRVTPPLPLLLLSTSNLISLHSTPISKYPTHVSNALFNTRRDGLTRCAAHRGLRARCRRRAAAAQERGASARRCTAAALGRRIDRRAAAA